MHAKDAVVAGELVEIAAHGCQTYAKLSLELGDRYPASTRHQREHVFLSLRGQ
jgi:hypothetical protein